MDGIDWDVVNKLPVGSKIGIRLPNDFKVKETVNLTIKEKTMTRNEAVQKLYGRIHPDQRHGFIEALEALGLLKIEKERSSENLKKYDAVRETIDNFNGSIVCFMSNLEAKGYEIVKKGNPDAE